MTTLNTTTATANHILPPEFGSLIQRPIEAESVAMNPAVATTVTANAHELHIPILDTDVTVDWAEEGAELDSTNPTMDQLKIDFKKIGGVNALTREMLDDSSPKASEIITTGLARQIVAGIDKAFFTDLSADNPQAPKGLAHITPTEVTGDLLNLDVFADSLAAAQAEGAAPTAFILAPADMLTLRKLKLADAHNAPLLGTDPAVPGSTTVFGVPIITSKYITAGEGYALDSRDVLVAQRQNLELAINDSYYFTSDRIAVRATARIGFGFPTEKKIVRMTFAGGE